MFQQYDVIVVGAGHAGCEAAAASATMGSKTLLVTMNMMTIGQMSCNPAMGGIAKGQIVREIDALGGLSGIVSDKSMIQFRMLNRSKGPAVWSPRTQNDRALFSIEWRNALEKIKNLDFWQDSVVEILTDGKRVTGVKTQLGYDIMAKSVVLTNGTFLNGIIHIGEKNYGGGRMAEKASMGLTENLYNLGFEGGRMKTGTPPRVDGRSLDYSQMEVQEGDENPEKFSFSDETKPLIKQRNCWITYTNESVHKELEKGFDRSPMFQGRIKGLGPRYCPSIEDKINRFSDRERHQLFVEPEGWNTVEIYLNGFSTSLPEDVQYAALTKIPGFQNAKMFRPGYAIEYDFFFPTQLKQTLETKLIENLFFAGQINGTTGYEEAAGQGLMAGINAHLNVQQKDPFILNRAQAYIGVLIDDLITKGTNEPYRMFTSRAEYRILLRHSSADLRLTPLGYSIGLASDERFEKTKKKEAETEKILQTIHSFPILPDNANALLERLGTGSLTEKTTAKNLLKRPQINFSELFQMNTDLAEKLKPYSKNSLEEAEILVKYETYLEREEDMVKKIYEQENFKIRPDFDYDRVKALSAESREKLKKIKPETIGQLSRISGVTPSDVSIITVYLGR